MKSNNFLRCVLCALFSCVLISIFCGVASANNIRIIGKPIITDQDTIKNTVLIKFDIAWDNSWFTSKPANYDAAWIFVKCWDGESWNHVYLEKDDAVAGSTVAKDAVNKGVDYSVTDREGKLKTMNMVLEPGYSYAWKKWHLDPTEDSVKCIVGFFLHRETFGAGHVVVPGVTFKWNYGNQGFVDEDDLVVKVFAIEMVYVPEGAYYLGGKGTADWQAGSFTTNEATFGSPMVITSEDAIEVKKDKDQATLWASNDFIEEGKIPAAFPKGYQAFYIMKYEMTQEAYCEFLNTLNQGQQDGRIEGTLANLAVNNFAWGSDLSQYRYQIRIKQAAPVAIFGMNANNNSVFDETDKVKYDSRDTLVRNIDGQDLAMHFVSFYDLLAYAEFSGLRPMTELEYEKACRGPREPVNDEYAWGSVTKVLYAIAFHNGWNSAWYNLKNDVNTFWDGNTGTESIGAAYNSVMTHNAQGWWGFAYCPAPVRVGIFADSTSTRAAAGASFWGVMNMSDNVAEMCISAVYEDLGRKFEGAHGCGQLDGNGDATNAKWHKTAAGGYYIIRGMRNTYWGGGGCSGDRSQQNEMWPGAYVYPGGSYTNHVWVTSGMVSSRGYAMVSPAGTERNFTKTANDCMRGIRLVRTDNTDK